MSRPGAAALQTCGRWLFRYRNFAFPAVLLTLLLGLPPAPAGSPAAGRWPDFAGLALALSGQVLRWFVIGLDYIKRGGVDRSIHASRLVITGAFAHARNPLYVGNLLILGGLFLVHGNPLACATGLPAVVFAYVAIVAAEEAYLRGRFGDAYAQYCRDVPRWIPRLAGLRATWAGSRFRWRRAVRKDSASAYAWMAGAWLLFLRESHAAGFAGYPSPAALTIAFAVITTAFVTVRVLKRSHLLRDD